MIPPRPHRRAHDGTWLLLPLLLLGAVSQADEPAERATALRQLGQAAEATAETVPLPVAVPGRDVLPVPRATMRRDAVRQATRETVREIVRTELARERADVAATVQGPPGKARQRDEAPRGQGARAAAAEAQGVNHGREVSAERREAKEHPHKKEDAGTSAQSLKGKASP